MSSDKSPTRDRILKSTWSLLEAGGGNKVRMSDIAKAAKVSRQAVYLHFPSRVELLVATTRYLDEAHDIDRQLDLSRSAVAGPDRLAAWIETWGNYIPKIFGVAKALMAMKESDAEAMTAWNDRMQAVRHGCAAAIESLHTGACLRGDLTKDEATDILWTLLSVRNWEQLRYECGWSQERYLERMKVIAAQTLTVPN